MDSTDIPPEILEIMILYNRQGVRRELQPNRSEDAELIGFSDGDMTFKKNIVNKLSKVHAEKVSEHCLKFKNISNNSSVNIKKNESLIMKEKKQIITLNTPDANGFNKIRTVMVDANGKKFIYLNGKKLQVVKSSPTVVQKKEPTLNQLTKTRIIKSQKDSLPNQLDTSEVIANKLEPLKSNDDILLANQSETTVTESSKYMKYIRNVSSSTSTNKTFHTVYTSRGVLPKLTGKIISVNKNPGFQNLTEIMKEVGGIRLVRQQSCVGIPLIKENISVNSSSKIDDTLEVYGPDEMEKCSCKNNLSSRNTSTNTEQVKSVHNVVSVSTNTELVKSVSKEVQTDVLVHNQENERCEVDSPLTELYNGSLIIGNDVNMGHGPPSLFASNQQHMKLKFFDDLQRCLKWESGNL